MEQKILAYYKEHEAEIFEDLKTLVLAEASTADLAELAECRKVLEELIKARTGITPIVHKSQGGHDPVQFEYGEGEEKVLFVGHYDTVHPIGALKYYVDEFVKRKHDGLTNFVIIGYSSSIDIAHQLKERIETQTDFKGIIHLMQMGAVVGTHVGLNGVSLFFMEK